MSNARYSNIRNLPAQVKSLDAGNINVADTLTASSLSCEVSSGSVPFTTTPAGKHIRKLTVYSDGAGAWRADNTPTPMVTTQNGSTNFQFPENAVVVAARLESLSAPVAGSVTLTVTAGGHGVFTATPIVNVNSRLGAQVSTLAGNVFGSTGAVSTVSVNQGDTVLLTSNTASTSGDVFVCLYYYV